MEDWEKRIYEILGEESALSKENGCRYLSYLERELKFPVRVTGREDFDWEEPYVFGGWSQTEYARLKKIRPSYTDEFDLLSLSLPNKQDDLTAKIRRVADRKVFAIGLSWLTALDENSTDHIILNDYATWYVNF